MRQLPIMPDGASQARSSGIDSRGDNRRIPKGTDLKVTKTKGIEKIWAKAREKIQQVLPIEFNFPCRTVCSTKPEDWRWSVQWQCCRISQLCTPGIECVSETRSLILWDPGGIFQAGKALSTSILVTALEAALPNENTYTSSSIRFDPRRRTTGLKCTFQTSNGLHSFDFPPSFVKRFPYFS